MYHAKQSSYDAVSCLFFVCLLVTYSDGAENCNKSTQVILAGTASKQIISLVTYSDGAKNCNKSTQVILAGTASKQIISLRATPSLSDVIPLQIKMKYNF